MPPTSPAMSIASPALTSQSDTLPWLCLARLPGLGRKRRLTLLQQFDDPLELLATTEAVWQAAALPQKTREALRAWQAQDTAHPLLIALKQIQASCQALSIEMVTWGDHDYPEPLRHIHDAPLVLYLQGDRRLLVRPQIGLVGSRNATPTGLQLAHEFAADLSERGYLVTSGLALGIDGAAHRGALDAGYPTLAVVGTGVDVDYPRQHRSLSEQIRRQGLLVSDLPPGTPARAAHFPQRNRLISGLSRGVLVVEASLRSGSLTTARLALEQGREVFAVPGSVRNPQAQGCHRLIRQGAALVETVADIEEELGGWQVASSPVPSPSPASVESDAGGSVAEADLPAREIAVLQALGYDPQSTDTLCEATGLAADQLLQSLLMLEMQGLVASVPGGYQRLR